MAHAELSGARSTRAVDNFLYDVIKHRAMSNVVLNGDSTGKSAGLDAAAAALTPAVTRLIAAVARFDAAA